MREGPQDGKRPRAKYSVADPERRDDELGPGVAWRADEQRRRAEGRGFAHKKWVVEPVTLVGGVTSGEAAAKLKVFTHELSDCVGEYDTFLLLWPVGFRAHALNVSGRQQNQRAPGRNFLVNFFDAWIIVADEWPKAVASARFMHHPFNIYDNAPLRY